MCVDTPRKPLESVPFPFRGPLLELCRRRIPRNRGPRSTTSAPHPTSTHAQPLDSILFALYLYLPPPTSLSLIPALFTSISHCLFPWGEIGRLPFATPGSPGCKGSRRDRVGAFLYNCELSPPPKPPTFPSSSELSSPFCVSPSPLAVRSSRSAPLSLNTKLTPFPRQYCSNFQHGIFEQHERADGRATLPTIGAR